MTDQKLFMAADQYLNSVVQQIGDTQWTTLIPDWIKMGSNVDRNGMVLRTLINYHAYDDIWVPDMLAGKTMAEVGVDKWKNEDLLGADPKTKFAEITEKAVVAASQVSDDDLLKMAHLSFGDYTIKDYFAQITQFRGFRAHEFAKVIGIDTTMPPELVQGLWDQLTPHVEEWRSIGVFGPAIEVSDNAPLQNKLLALTGRDPAVTAN